MEHPIVVLYQAFQKAWNDRDVASIGSAYAPTAIQVDFSGTTIVGADSMRGHFSRIFRDPKCGTMIGTIREIRELAPDVVLLRAVAGYVPPRRTRIDPRRTEVQTVVFSRKGSGWRIELFQVTPAALHGHPEIEEQLSHEIQDAQAIPSVA